MSARRTEIVFRRPKAGYWECDPEHWEDSAISKAYDRAVEVSEKDEESTVQKELHSPYTYGDGDDVQRISHTHREIVWDRHVTPKKTENSNERTSRKTSPATQDKNTCMEEAKSNDWRVGEECIAMYQEDGLYYKCNIISIKDLIKSCVVEYVGYGNKETVKLCDLYTLDAWEHSSRGKSAASTSGTNDSSSVGGTSSDVTQDIYRRSGKKSVETRRRFKRHDNHPNSTMPRPNPPFSPTFLVPPPLFMGPMSPAAPGAAPASLHEHNFSSDDMSDDALSSMLMSWYMAGYHTGYYQGVNSKNSRKRGKEE